MAKTGEECWHQKNRRTKVDEGGDIQFDPDLMDYCDALHVYVVPAKRCGTSCDHFKPFGNVPMLNNPTIANTNGTRLNASPVLKAKPPSPLETAKLQAARERARALQRRPSVLGYMHELCQEIEKNVAYLRDQLDIRQRQWKELNTWLRRPDRQEEVLRRELAIAQEMITRYEEELREIERRLLFIGHKRHGSKRLGLLSSQFDEISESLERCEQMSAQLESMLRERQRKQEEYVRIFYKWRDARERIPLLEKLRTVITQCVRSWLDTNGEQLSDADVMRIKDVLHDIVNSRYTEDDVTIADLAAYIESLPERFSQE